MIGIFDSGVGGLTVVQEIFKKLPEYKIIYFGDTARVPYGTKSKDTVTRYALENTHFLIKNKASIIIVACNTASALALNTLQKNFDLSIIGVIEPAVKKAVGVTSSGKIGVIGTRSTIESSIYKKAIKQIHADAEIYLKACPLLVSLVEENWIKTVETKRILKKYLKPFKDYNIDTLILGCTHYPLLSDMISNIIGKSVTIVDPATETVDEVKEILENNDDLKKKLKKAKNHKFYFSDITPHLEEIAQKFLGRKIENIEKVDLEKE